MKIALLGYGKMGQEIHAMAEKRGHQIVLVIDNDEEWQEKGPLLKEADAAIEFTTPDSAVDNIMNCFQYDVYIIGVYQTAFYFNNCIMIRKSDGIKSIIVNRCIAFLEKIHIFP